MIKKNKKKHKCLTCNNTGFVLKESAPIIDIFPWADPLLVWDINETCPNCEIWKTGYDIDIDIDN